MVKSLRNEKIVDVINQYPIVGEFLLDNKIECATCMIATCKLKDILEVHQIEGTLQDEMMDYINKLITKEVTQSKQFQIEVVEEENHTMMQRLYDEHDIILELIYVGEYFCLIHDTKALEKVFNYFKLYADIFHHGKEEDMVFYAYRNQLVMIESMYEEHDYGRSLIKSIIEQNYPQDLCKQYFQFLKDHIRKENEIVFPYLNHNLSEEDKNMGLQVLQTLDTLIEEEVKEYIRKANQFNL